HRPSISESFHAAAESHIIFKHALSSPFENLSFETRPMFISQEGLTEGIEVIGHHQLEFRVVSEESSLLKTGYKRLDQHVQDLLLQLHKACPAVESELKDLIPVLDSLASFLGVYSQGGVFKENIKVSEAEFQQHVLRHMRTKLGPDVLEHCQQAGGI